MLEAPTDVALVDTLIEELERLPMEPSIAMRVVWIADDPASSAKDLASAISLDPALSARLLRLANSAYYGLSGRVGNVGFAVTVVGFPTVRAMAAATASGLFTAGERVAPDGFWEHGLAVATAASKLADRLGIRPPDAVALGLLHDLGSTLLFRSDPDRYDEVVRRSTRERIPLSVAELEAFGIAHDDAGARVFAAWRFPDSFVEAVGRHHDPVDWGWEASTRLLVAAEAVAARLPRAPTFELGGGRDDGLAAMGISTVDAARLAAAVKEEATELLGAFS